MPNNLENDKRGGWWGQVSTNFAYVAISKIKRKQDMDSLNWATLSGFEKSFRRTRGDRERRTCAFLESLENELSSASSETPWPGYPIIFTCHKNRSRPLPL